MLRIDRITQQIKELIPDWKLGSIIKALEALRGVSDIVGATVVAELGSLARFQNAKELMAYIGLVPKEHSSGSSIRRGGITKTGNGHVRRALVEAAHAYLHPARESRVIKSRLEGLPQEIREISWKAQVRLCGDSNQPANIRVIKRRHRIPSLTVPWEIYSKNTPCNKGMVSYFLLD